MELLVIINLLLMRHRGPISTFHLYLPNMGLDSIQEVQHWMLVLSRNNIEDLYLVNSNQPYELPLHVFTCLELTRLKLVNCIMKPPLDFQGFLNLKSLFLKKVDFRANSLVPLPQVTNLDLLWCTNVYNFNIEARALQTLAVVACPDALLLRLLDLTDVSIYLVKPIKDFARVGRINLVTLLTNMPNISSFAIDGSYLKFFSAAAGEIPKRFPHALNSLKSLWLFDLQLADLDQLRGALGLIAEYGPSTCTYDFSSGAF